MQLSGVGIWTTNEEGLETLLEDQRWRYKSN